MADTKSIYNFRFGNATHVGQKRMANEDYFGSFETPNGYAFLVCDGMGGHVGGAKASQLAVTTIRDYLLSEPISDAGIVLRDAILAANNAILNYTALYPDLKGMGSTCVALLVRDSDVYYAHVGDSRIYFMTDDKMLRITKDHSFVQTLVDLGEISEEEAESHPRKNEITNALGLPNMKPPTVSPFPIKVAKGDTFLLCSDGLTGMVSDDVVARTLKNITDIQGTANKLVELANQNGGVDNITVQIVHFHNSGYKKTETHISSVSKRSENKRKLFIMIAVAAIIIGGGIFITSTIIYKSGKESGTENMTDSLRIQSISDTAHGLDKESKGTQTDPKIKEGDKGTIIPKVRKLSGSEKKGDKPIESKDQKNAFKNDKSDPVQTPPINVKKEKSLKPDSIKKDTITKDTPDHPKGKTNNPSSKAVK